MNESVFEEEYELIVVYGESEDDTEKVVLNLNSIFDIKINSFKQSLNGKANAVWEAVEASENNLIAILDSDQSVDPEIPIDFLKYLKTVMLILLMAQD